MAKTKSKTAKRIGQAIMIIGVIIIPLLYSFFYLEAFWDPYARLNDVPVAIVNMDEGATINGNDRNIGSEVCKNLLDDGTLKFIETTQQDAEDGVLNQKYYASISIPKDFSKCVATTSQDTEKLHTKITYSANQKKNYLAAQIIENAMPRVQMKVNSSIDKEIISTLSDQISGVPDQMGELQDGLTKLRNGSVDLKDGTSQLAGGTNTLATGSKTLSDGALKVADGSKTLSAGLNTLNNGTAELNSKVPELASGVSQLDDGAKQLTVGAESLATGLETYTGGVNQAYSGSLDLKNGIDAYTSGAETASEGATTLKDGVSAYTAGVNQAFEGTMQLNSGLTQYAQGVTSATNGAKQLQTGVKAYTDGATEIENGYKDFSNSLNTVASAVSTISAGASQVNTAYQQALSLLNAGQVEQATVILNQLSDSISSVSNGLAQVNAGFGSAEADNTLLNADAKIKAGLNQMTSKNEEINTGAAALVEGLETLDTKSGDLTYGATALELGLDNLSQKSTFLNNGAIQLSTGLDTLNENNDALVTGAGQLMLGLDTLSQKSTFVNNGAYQVMNGASQLSNGLSTLNSNVPALADGVSAIANGSQQLYDGSKSLTNGATKVSNGSAKLYDGVLTLKTGATKLNNGAGQLKDGLNTARTGVDDSVLDTTEKLKVLDGLAEYSEEPVAVDTVNIQPVENYGSAFAPYFMCLSLWVGGLMIFFGIYLDYNKKIKSLTKDGKYFRNKCIAFTLIGLAQGGALALVVKYALGIVINNELFLIASCALVAMCFMTIIQFLIMVLGNAGKFLSLFLLILQLTSCAGTFPLETQSEFFQIINKLLPMTYATQLFKEAISGTVGDWAWKNFLIIVAFWVGALVLGFIGRIIDKSKKKKAPQLELAQA